MSGLTGGVAYDVYYHKNRSWRPIGPVVDEWQFYTAKADDAYVCLGVVGNAKHWAIKNAGDHTSRSTHSTIIGGKTVYPKAGWVYAIDGRVPDMAKFETWLVGQVKAGKYSHLKYFNINNRHYNQKAGWKPVHSSDGHLHMSFDPGQEYADSSILADYERYRTGKAPAPKPKPKPKPAPPAQPTIYKGAKGTWVRRLQALLVANGRSLKIDGIFGARTYAAVRAFQTAKRIGIDGIVGPQTWGKLLAGKATVRRGSKGLAVRIVQALLVAAGYALTIDGDFGPKTDAAVEKFQAAKRIKKDGIAGPITLGRLVNG